MLFINFMLLSYPRVVTCNPPIYLFIGVFPHFVVNSIVSAINTWGFKSTYTLIKSRYLSDWIKFAPEYLCCLQRNHCETITRRSREVCRVVNEKYCFRKRTDGSSRCSNNRLNSAIGARASFGEFYNASFCSLRFTQLAERIKASSG